MPRRAIITLVLVLGLHLPAEARSEPQRGRCEAVTGEAYILCKEGGDIDAHPGPSSAWGLYGFLDQTWRAYCPQWFRTTDAGKQRICALRYLNDRYDGSWTKAAAHHRRRNYW